MESVKCAGVVAKGGGVGGGSFVKHGGRKGNSPVGFYGSVF